MNPATQHVMSLLPAGQRFGSLEVLYRIYVPGAKNSRYAVRCVACGREKSLARCQLVSGDTRSCGCQRQVLAFDGCRQYTAPPVLRLRQPSRRCPVCARSQALTPVTMRLPDGQFWPAGRFCRYCATVTELALAPAPPPA